MLIRDGLGRGFEMGVNNRNRGLVDSVQKTVNQQATLDGESFNLNTGNINLTSGSESAVFYVQNTDNENNLVIDFIVFILGASNIASTSESTDAKIVRNPTGGTLITGASDVDVNSNRNFFSGKELLVNAYKGAEGNTVTGGTDHFETIINHPTRVQVSVDILLGVNNSLAVAYTPPSLNTSLNVMVAAICHREPRTA